MTDGFGVDRLIVMHNDFIVLGPSADPAAIKGAKTTPEAFKKIAAAGALFLSRGDNSGTHAKEKGIWKAAGIKPAGQKWYQETGLGMGQTLNVANEKNGYTLADRGTYLAMKKNLSLAILKEGDPILLNVYHVIGVNPAKWPKVNTAGAKAFSALHGLRGDSGDHQDLRRGEVRRGALLPRCGQARVRIIIAARGSKRMLWGRSAPPQHPMKQNRWCDRWISFWKASNRRSIS